MDNSSDWLIAQDGIQNNSFGLACPWYKDQWMKCQFTVWHK